jgi:hypothetical protein
MELQLLHDFLKSGKTQKDFAKESGMPVNSLGTKLTKQLRKLEKTKVINLSDYVKDKQSILTVEIRNKSEMWLRAIEAYNSEMRKIEAREKLSEKYYFSFDEVAQFSKWFNRMNAQTQYLAEETDMRLYARIQEIIQN